MGFKNQLWVGFYLLVAACGSDDQASVNLPQEPIAAGAYYPLSVSDACRGGGKINFCTSESVVSIDSLTVDNPRVADVLHMEQLNEGLRVAYAELVVDAKRSGSTSLTIDATFDDGSQRKVETEVVVAQANRIELTHGCSVDEPDDPDLFPAQHEVLLTVDLFRKAQRLNGEYQASLLQGDGLHRVPGQLKQNAYVWTAPDEPGAVSLTSPPFPRFSQAYRSYSSADVSIDSVTRRYEGRYTYQTSVPFDVELTVDGERPCELPPLRLETRTPEVCAGPDGAVSWLRENPAYGVSVRALSSGNCALTVSVEGTSTAIDVEVEFDVMEAPAVPEDRCASVVCEPISSCPDGSELATRDCCATCVALSSPQQCEAQRATWDELYETELEGATACNADSDCGPVVLLGGCRRYCFVALNHERTADFMNAISEDYFTSCPSCQVTEPADCVGSGDVFCNEGRCSLR